MSAYKVSKKLARQVAQRLDRHWTAEVAYLSDIRHVIAKGVLLPMSLRDILDQKEDVERWVNSLSRDDLKQMVRYIEEAHWKGRDVQYRMSDKKFDGLQERDRREMRNAGG